ncbi:hypothetical protein HYPSUDRAFT_201781 [Hypholoma sublateritium FD-334 SS-4]|uniref:Uncharacterized protein n=1 Tax=Hypholoma sublateritium (strain FD-334 SS-4) TaxID=945553 RepID=A0A0D2P2M3_HYPSF|nr:hypothetical protein HYPSUDRAFT_201781 [Hypholoma sublateritium FD-334 SS-4]
MTTAHARAHIGPRPATPASMPTLARPGVRERPVFEVQQPCIVRARGTELGHGCISCLGFRPGINHAHLHGGVLNRYDHFPPYVPDANRFVDELAFDAGMGMGNRSADPSAGGTGFKGHYSQTADGLISGARSNTGRRFGSEPAATSLFTSVGLALSMPLSSLACTAPSFSDSSPGFGAGPDAADAGDTRARCAATRRIY